MNNNRHRPTILDNPQVGVARHSAYKGTIDYYHRAIKGGFYIEAIALMESIMADRMESLLNAIVKAENANGGHLKEYSFIPLSRSIAIALKYDIIWDYQPMVDILNRIKEWFEDRNAAIHRMAKLSRIDDKKPAEDKYESFKKPAKDSYKLFRELDKIISSARKNGILP